METMKNLYQFYYIQTRTELQPRQFYVFVWFLMSLIRIYPYVVVEVITVYYKYYKYSVYFIMF